MAHPYLEEERKRRPGDMDIPIDDPYPDQQAMALAPPPAPSLAPTKAPAAPQALASSLTPTKDMPDPYEEKPLQAEAGPSRWVKALNALPAIASGAMHLSGYGNEQTRQQGYRMASDAAAQNMELDRRAANSRARAAMYNNKLQQRRQALARQKEQDTIAAEDRGRRIKAEDLQIQLEAEKRDPTSPKNMAFKKSLADAYPVVWNSLTPEEQENMTVERGQALQLQLQDEARKRELADDIKKEWEKQRAEYVWWRPGGGLGGINFMNAMGGGGGGPNTMPSPPGENTYLKDLEAIHAEYGEPVPENEKVRAKYLWAATQAQVPGVAGQAQAFIDDVVKGRQNKLAEERNQRKEEAAAKKVEAQEDNQYAVQRRVRGLDKLRANIEDLERAIGNKKDIPGQGLTGMLPDQVLTHAGQDVSMAKLRLNDTMVREATGAVANVPEEKKFERILGIGPLATDEQLRLGLQKAREYLQRQEDFLDAYYPGASGRFRTKMAEIEARKKEEEAKKQQAPDYTKLEGYTPPPK